MKRSPRRFGQPSFVSFFSGCGGLDLGFVQAGFRCLRAFDNDEAAVRTHRKNLGNSIESQDLNDALEFNFLECPDIVLSGSPCQGFSTIGKRLLDDDRNKLLLRGAELAVSLKPKIFISENVPAVRYGAHNVYWEGLKTFLAQHGYQTSTVELNAQDFGVAQVRRRTFLIGSLGGDPPSLQPKSQRPLVLRDVIADLEQVSLPELDHNPSPLGSASERRIAEHIGPGQKLCNVRAGVRAVPTWNVPGVFGATTQQERSILSTIRALRRRERRRMGGDADPVDRLSVNRELGFCTCTLLARLVEKNYLKRVDEHFDFTHTFNGKYRRLSWDQPSCTVDTRFGQARSVLHPSKDRAMTLREAARIQGFPDTFEFVGAGASKFRMVGNAVPPPMARALATEVMAMVKTTR